MQAAVVAKAKARGVLPAPGARGRHGTQASPSSAPARPASARPRSSPSGATASTSSRGRTAPGGAVQPHPGAPPRPGDHDSDLPFVPRCRHRAQAEERGARPGRAARPGLRGRAGGRRPAGEPIRLGIPGEERRSPASTTCDDPARHPAQGGQVAVVGGGATAVDCAVTASGAAPPQVELFALEKLSRDAAHRQGAARAPGARDPGHRPRRGHRDLGAR